MSDRLFPQTPLNRQLARRIFLEDLDECARFPKYFEVETVNACNARCTMCTINDWTTGGSSVMKMSLIEKLARELGPHRDWVEHVCLNRDGEPTLDKSLARRVRLLKQAGVKKVTFATNGQLMTEKFLTELCEAGLDDIMVSIDGATKATFERIRVRLDFETVVANTLALIRLRDHLRPAMTIRIRAVVMPENEHEISDIITFWKPKLGRGDSIYAMPMHSWGNQQYAESEENIAYYADKPCVSPFSTLVIDVNGTVPLCGCDYNAKVPLGDFRAQSIEEIWQSPRFARIRQQHARARRNEIPLCRGCDIWDRPLVGLKIDNDRTSPEEMPDDIPHKNTLSKIHQELARRES